MSLVILNDIQKCCLIERVHLHTHFVLMCPYPHPEMKVQTERLWILSQATSTF